MCDERERLIGFVYDECDAEERRRVEDHIDACSTCRAEISALREVRQDLLAWRVPLHEPVWRPLPVAVPVMPWYRQVPAWALAAAASVMFVSGVAGGALASAWLPRAAAVNAARGSETVAPIVTPAQLTQAEQRIIQLMRAELSGIDRELSGIDRKVQQVSTSAGSGRVVNASFSSELAEQVRGLQTSTEERDERLFELINLATNDIARVQKRVRELTEVHASGGGQQNNK